MAEAINEWLERHGHTEFAFGIRAYLPEAVSEDGVKGFAMFLPFDLPGVEITPNLIADLAGSIKDQAGLALGRPVAWGETEWLMGRFPLWALEESE